MSGNNPSLFFEGVKAVIKPIVKEAVREELAAIENGRSKPEPLLLNTKDAARQGGISHGIKV